MHFFESFIYILAFIMIGMIIRPLKRRIILSILSIAIGVFTLHVIFEATRWQLFPLYVALLTSGVIVYLKTARNVVFKNRLRKSLFGGLLVLALISLATSLIFPMYEMPEPTGDYLIGTQSFIINDENRLENYGEEVNTYRSFKIQTWYPAQTSEEGALEPWLEDGKIVARALSRDIGLPFFVLDHTANIMSNAYKNASISEAEDAYPLIILSHGWRGFKNVHSDLAEELASQGYIVVGIDHTYGSIATVLSDETVYLDEDALPPRETTPDFLEHANQLVNTYAGDITTTIDFLESIDETEHSLQIASAMDLTTIGLLGHSTGGGADVAVALNDVRIDALLGMDAWVEPLEEPLLSEGLDMPSLFLRSGAWEISYNNDSLSTLIENSTESSPLYQIDGTTHYDFAMVYMYSPLTKYIGFTGSVESEHLNTIMKTMITNFFDDTLKNYPNSDINPGSWDDVREISLD